jgi:hypothetical protein
MDDDVISQGGDREPGPWPRRLTVIAVLVALACGAAYLTVDVVSQRSPGSAAASLPPEPVWLLAELAGYSK